MKLPKLYSRTTNGSIQEWVIEVIENTFLTHEGLKDGKITSSTPTVCYGKNIGKSNETSDADQALLEAKAKWKKKIDSGYFEDISKIDCKTFIEPMLAKKYEDEFNQNYPVFSQCKLDGQRCVCKNDGMWSRNGKKIVSAPHIRKALQPIFDKDPEAVFDGELYCHKFSSDFNKIMSLVKKTKPTIEDLIESEKFIEYWIYDYISEGVKDYEERSNKIIEDISGLNKCLIVVPTDIANNQKELDDLFGKYIQEGYEGQMIRLDKPYEHKRSKYLLKRKEFDDTEFEIVDIIEGDGNKSGMAGYAVIKDLQNGNICKSNIKGNQEWLRELLNNKLEIIGELGTVRHFRRTPDGYPRFPYLVTIRNYE